MYSNALEYTLIGGLEDNTFYVSTVFYDRALKVELVSISAPFKEASLERFIAACARVCRSNDSLRDVYNQLEDSDVRRLVRGLYRAGHHSVFEHVVFTFWVEGISRACSHQLVRHRIASYSQRSQRHTRVNGFVTPERIMASSEASKIYEEALKRCADTYKQLLSLGIPLEDARFVLPQASETGIVVTMNLRELLHFFRLRLAPEAQWEIREVARRMFNLVKPYVPTVIEEFTSDTGYSVRGV